MKLTDMRDYSVVAISQIWRILIMKEKLINKLKQNPKIFKWTDLRSLLLKSGFSETQGAGSRVRFFNKKYNCTIILHKPHPGNEVKMYVIKELKNTLTKIGLI